MAPNDDSSKQNRTEFIVRYLEILFNTINHVLIGYVSIYLSYLCYMMSISSIMTWHIFLTAVGYHFFMAESFLTLYAANTWTMENSPETKRRLHWILQLIGCVAIIVGTAIEVWDKERRNRSHFKSDHAITGLVSIIFIVLSMLNGVASIYAYKIRNIIKPIYVKMSHYICGIVAFVIGMTSLALEYSPRRMVSTENVNMLILFSSIVAALTCIGVAKTMYSQFKGMCR
ncbi:probable transmembrane reductase CYB561D1 [Armigeres subalbatus]|uniref:probable transmembrane reductase CYB561D1 n=1 Tax=Armigeres subalbatus TaxID=124917 RepID=UPI002ED640EC